MQLCILIEEAHEVAVRWYRSEINREVCFEKIIPQKMSANLLSVAFQSTVHHSFRGKISGLSQNEPLYAILIVNENRLISQEIYRTGQEKVCPDDTWSVSVKISDMSSYVYTMHPALIFQYQLFLLRHSIFLIGVMNMWHALLYSDKTLISSKIKTDDLSLEALKNLTRGKAASQTQLRSGIFAGACIFSADYLKEM